MGIPSMIGAVKYLPASLGVKFLEKLNPKFKNYFTTAASYGFDANRALDYVKDRFENEASKTFKGQLQQGAQAGTLRPDEKSAKRQIENAELPGKVARSAAAFGGAALAGGLPALAGQAASQLSDLGEGEHVPGLGQYQGEHVPRNPREEAYKSMKKKKGLAGQMEEDFERQYGQQTSNEKTALLQATREGLNILRGLRGG